MKGRRTLASSTSEGETGGLSVKDPPLRGPLLCESLPDASGDTSCWKSRKTKSTIIWKSKKSWKKNRNRAAVEETLCVRQNEEIFDSKRKRTEETDKMQIKWQIRRYGAFHEHHRRKSNALFLKLVTEPNTHRLWHDAFHNHLWGLRRGKGERVAGKRADTSVVELLSQVLRYCTGDRNRCSRWGQGFGHLRGRRTPWTREELHGLKWCLRRPEQRGVRVPWLKHWFFHCDFLG